VNVEATIAALRACLDRIDAADCVLLTDAAVNCEHDGIRIVPIARLDSSRDYSAFILTQLADHVRSSHCLIVQWDGFVLDAGSWEDAFLEFDYIGAPWPQFDDDHAVGNGGFSLRSRKMLEACRDPSFVTGHPEDVAICRTNRDLLEEKFGMRFADRETAGRFAFERAGHGRATFGFHGIFNMVQAVGSERFWELYGRLDDPSTAFVDYRALMRQIGAGRQVWRRRLKLTAGMVRHLFRTKARLGIGRAPATRNHGPPTVSRRT
jgi:hypothetical protein